MNKEMAMEIATSLVNANNNALIGTISEDKYPNIKALTKMKNEGLKVFYFSTNKSTTKVKQIRNNSIGCIYFFDPMRYIGVMLEGDFEITNDLNEIDPNIYKPEGLKTDDFCTLKFTSKSLYVYSNFERIQFEI